MQRLQPLLRYTIAPRLTVPGSMLSNYSYRPIRGFSFTSRFSPVPRFTSNLKWLPMLMIGSTAGVLYFNYKNKQFYRAFKEIKERRQNELAPRPIESFCSSFQAASENRFLNFEKPTIRKSSIEVTTQLNAAFFGSPRLTLKEGWRSELNALFAGRWRDFTAMSADKLTITFGHRKAFNATTSLPFTHAVLYVVDSEGNHGIYGYIADKKNFIINEKVNATVSREYTLYPRLTITGNREQMIQLFERIEHISSLQNYTFIGCNCYSALILALTEAEKMGFSVPKDFEESLLIGIPAEQNYGMGVTSNQYLKPLAQNATMRVGLFIDKVKEKTDASMKMMKSSRN